ncbi:MAG: glycoside hydrolase [Ignavibacteria bacterium]|nr:glycoside hydrolase [Ignavibacteria bacterium]
MRTINFLAAAALMIFFININIAQWQNDVMLTFDPAVSTTSYNNATCLASAGNTLHLAWEETRDGNNEIYYKRSIDGGTTWGANTRITNDTNYSPKPSIAVSGVFFMLYGPKRVMAMQRYITSAHQMAVQHGNGYKINE